MPVFKIIEIDNTKIGLWKNTQTIEQLLETARNDISNIDYIKISEFTSINRQKEWICTRLLAKAINNDKYLQIYYDENHKPLINNGLIGISHKDDYVAIIQSADKNVSIDIEKISEKTSKISSKFLSKKEQNIFNTSNIKLTTLLWSVKECVYKYYSKKKLAFAQNIEIQPFDIEKDKKVNVWLKQQIPIKVHFTFFDNFVLTYIFE